MAEMCDGDATCPSRDLGMVGRATYLLVLANIDASLRRGKVFCRIKINVAEVKTDRNSEKRLQGEMKLERRT